MMLQAPHCPSCGAPVEVPVGASRVTCGYCQTSLVVGSQAISTIGAVPRAAQPKAKAPPFPEPDATLRNWQVGRFEISLVEQPIPGSVPEVFAGFEAGEGRFAFVSMRLVDADGVVLRGALDAAFGALRTSLEHDADPGLAANLALESLCAATFAGRLEVAIALFEPARMRVTPYSAGAREPIAWASSEAGRCTILSGHSSPLERKSLKERGSQFENGQPIHLAASDLVLFPSPGFLGRGGKGSGNGLRLMLDTANEHLGEAPLRIVTLAKNAFWEDFQANTWSRPVPVGDVRLVAVRAVLPVLRTDALPGSIITLRSKRYEVALLTFEGERFALLPLHDERQAVVWTRGLSEAQFQTYCGHVMAVLDRKEHGDNENPRRAGREAQAAVAATSALVAHLSDRHGRIKWWRHQWHQPIQLGPRGVKADGHQAFDEGGEATVSEGHRLLFPGSLPVDGQPQHADALAEGWPGGKASRLYDSLTTHWKTKRSAVALEHLARAAGSDVSTGLEGLALFTGL